MQFTRLPFSESYPLKPKERNNLNEDERCRDNREGSNYLVVSTCLETVPSTLARTIPKLCVINLISATMRQIHLFFLFDLLFDLLSASSALLLSADRFRLFDLRLEERWSLSLSDSLLLAGEDAELDASELPLFSSSETESSSSYSPLRR